MLPSLALSLFLVATPAPQPAPTPGVAVATTAPAPAAKNAIDKLNEWLKQNVRRRDRLSQTQIVELERRIEDLGKLATGRSKYSLEARTTLLDMASYGLAKSDSSYSASAIRSIAQASLSRRLKPGHGGKLLEWLTDEVLLLTDRYTPLQRSVAVRALGQRCIEHEPSSHLLLALVQAGRDADSGVRAPALNALQGRPEDFITSFFLSGLERGTVPPELLADHMRMVAVLKGAEVPTASLAASRIRRLLDYVAARLFHEDWREASRCIALMPLLDADMAVPMLVEGLNQWIASTESGGGSRRVVHECRQALTLFAGRDLGLNPQIWATWWRQQSEPGAVVPPAPSETARATFFGLRPVSDKLLFLIDRSGSMRENYGGRNSRFEEAVDRLLYTLRDLGDTTQFRVVLFSDGAQTFRQELMPATEANLAKLKSWALHIGTGGGTDLAAGVHSSFPGLASGKLAPSEIDVDTVIVLCDGETENPDWVAPWLARYNDAARLKFHCVNLGGKPGGVLEALAEGSGGRFVLAEDK